MNEANCAGFGGAGRFIHTAQFVALIEVLRVVSD